MELYGTKTKRYMCSRHIQYLSASYHKRTRGKKGGLNVERAILRTVIFNESIDYDLYIL
jgi:hypothetical protein